jgi:hypothetical protein
MSKRYIMQEKKNDEIIKKSLKTKLIQQNVRRNEIRYDFSFHEFSGQISLIFYSKISFKFYYFLNFKEGTM